MRAPATHPHGHGSSIRFPLRRHLGSGFRTIMPTHAAWRVKLAPRTPDTSVRTSGTRSSRVKAKLTLCASTCTRDPLFELGSVSSIQHSFPRMGHSKGWWQRLACACADSRRTTIRRPAFRPPLLPGMTHAPAFARPTDPTCRRSFPVMIGEFPCAQWAALVNALTCLRSGPIHVFAYSFPFSDGVNRLW